MSIMMSWETTGTTGANYVEHYAFHYANNFDQFGVAQGGVP